MFQQFQYHLSNNFHLFNIYKNYKNNFKDQYMHDILYTKLYIILFLNMTYKQFETIMHVIYSINFNYFKLFSINYLCISNVKAR